MVLDNQLSVISYQLSVISYQLSVISYQLSDCSFKYIVLGENLGTFFSLITDYCSLLTEKSPHFSRRIKLCGHF
ncbi:MAG: hypothetical protein EWV53_19230 [Microcystis panniformis Mp_MB_F_20051200_S9]|uniref:Uncharacterized protein n=1 Tax=Microcystis panniformis Mp_MB_F_20051200_S9 TaxID=2486223 RepID=A0A552PMS7_9CHRO|nr:MAG: hypothetical protein EWV42_20000 [Microcystis panniformis Mp_GB_SS_20050300_S99D]TRV46999.1 MAG: hypothetical protein EWV43_13790 [Microcystis panniformis Mp_MB_F_20080800_S26D]TRV49017.1 MAG: hypothetical protein EWV87_11215 [Microcystis panniformis Mp_GB_SS_20050300_S99]TRV58290.1 MAG: hypothetical protein EWV53_19230 [Microcystis panniformis Mp_MB_F_20051200_S9]TRV63170.1 MAG: hypothetical protein EWV86_12685 [Microcystis panniformis Mp_MB_F_20051200_S9D]TRV64565.1 MAG: hypothetical